MVKNVMKRAGYAGLLIAILVILVMRATWPTGSAEASAKEVEVRQVLPNPAIQRRKIIEELQGIRQQLAEIHSDLKSGKLAIRIVTVKQQKGAGVAGQDKP